MKTTSPKYLKNDDVVLREEFGQWLFFNPDTNTERYSNQLGVFIWEACDGASDINHIVAAVRAAFDGVPEDTVFTDVKATLDKMLADQFISVVA